MDFHDLRPAVNDLLNLAIFQLIESQNCPLEIEIFPHFMSLFYLDLVELCLLFAFSSPFQKQETEKVGIILANAAYSLHSNDLFLKDQTAQKR